MTTGYVHPGRRTTWPVTVDENSCAVPCSGGGSPSRAHAAASAAASRTWVLIVTMWDMRGSPERVGRRGRAGGRTSLNGQLGRQQVEHDVAVDRQVAQPLGELPEHQPGRDRRGVHG